MVLVYLAGEWSWVGRAMAARDGFAFRPCAKCLGHVGDHMPELGFVKAETYPNMGPECPRPAAPDPERDRRRELRARVERRRAARALDRYVEVMFGSEGRAAGERFVEAVGDYVESRLHHKGHYGATANCEMTE